MKTYSRQQRYAVCLPFGQTELRSGIIVQNGSRKYGGGGCCIICCVVSTIGCAICTVASGIGQVAQAVAPVVLPALAIATGGVGGLIDAAASIGTNAAATGLASDAAASLGADAASGLASLPGSVSTAAEAFGAGAPAICAGVQAMQAGLSAAPTLAPVMGSMANIPGNIGGNLPTGGGLDTLAAQTGTFATPPAVDPNVIGTTSNFASGLQTNATVDPTTGNITNVPTGQSLSGTPAPSTTPSLNDLKNVAQTASKVLSGSSATPAAGATPAAQTAQNASVSSGGGSQFASNPSICGIASILPGGSANRSNADLQVALQQMTPELSQVFQNAGYQIPMQTVVAREGGLIPRYYDGGTTTSPLAKMFGVQDILKCDCLAALQPKFEACNATMLGGGGHRSSPLALAALHHMAPIGSAIGSLAKGGLLQKYHDAAPEGHHPEFVTGVTGYYAGGRGTGQSDDIPAMLHDGDYVIDADAVAALGDGSSKAGHEALMHFMGQIPHKKQSQGNPVPAKIADGEVVLPESFVTALGGGDNKHGAKMLDEMRKRLREHKRSAPDSKIPPKARSPLAYLEGVKE